MKALPGWVISPMPEPPPRQHKHERRDTPSTHPFILTRRTWKDAYDGQIIFWDLVGLKLHDICLTGGENSEKTSLRKLVPTGIEPGPAAWQARMLSSVPQRWTSAINLSLIFHRKFIIPHTNQINTYLPVTNIQNIICKAMQLTLYIRLESYSNSCNVVSVSLTPILTFYVRTGTKLSIYYIIILNLSIEENIRKWNRLATTDSRLFFSPFLQVAF